METLEKNDPEIILRREFEREDQEDSLSLRWSLLAALIVHALLLTVALPAAEQDEEMRGWACSLPVSKEIYARPPATRSVPMIVPKPVVRSVCNMAPPEPIPLEPLLEVELELDLNPPLGRESPPSSRSLGITPQLTACVEPQWTEISRKARIQGAVILEITIQQDGTVTDPKVLKGLPMGLTDAAVEAVSNWRYAPIEHESEPVALRHVVVLRFQPGESNCHFWRWRSACSCLAERRKGLRPSIHSSSRTGSPTRPAREVRQ